MDKIERIARLLAKGMKQGTVATVVGVTPAYVSQLCKDQDFLETLKEIQAESMDKASTEQEETKFLDDRLLGLEHSAISQLESKVAFMEPRELTALLTALGIRREKLQTPKTIGTLEQSEFDANGNVRRTTTLSIPRICAPELTIGPNNEIIAIGSRSVAPMPTAALTKLLNANKEGTTYEHSVANSISENQD